LAFYSLQWGPFWLRQLVSSFHLDFALISTPLIFTNSKLWVLVFSAPSSSDELHLFLNNAASPSLNFWWFPLLFLKYEVIQHDEAWSEFFEILFMCGYGYKGCGGDICFCYKNPALVHLYFESRLRQTGTECIYTHGCEYRRLYFCFNLYR